MRYPTKEAILFSEDEGGSSFRQWIEGEDDDLVERLATFVQGRVAAGQDNAELRRLKMRAIWTDPYLRRVLRGKLEESEQLISASLAAELGLPADDSGPRVFAGAITGLFITMAEKAVAPPRQLRPACGVRPRSVVPACRRRRAQGGRSLSPLATLEPVGVDQASQEALRRRLTRGAEDLLRWPLLDDPAVLEEADLIGHVAGE